MKKHLITAFISLLMLFVIAGCSNSGNSGANGNRYAGNNNRNGFQKPNVYGEISAIDGNKVTLKLLKLPQMPRKKGQVRGSGTGNMGVNGAPRTGGGNGRFAGDNSGTGKGGMRSRAYTGEEKTIVIPEGVSMTIMTRGANGLNQSNVSLKDLTTGSTLSIYYNSDGKTIKNIKVQKPRTANGQTENSSN